MRRIMVFALLALALPTAALASSVDPAFETGTFVRGTVSADSVGGFAVGIFRVDVIGSMLHIKVNTNGLSSGCVGSGAGVCTFSSGTLSVFTLTNSVVPIFTDELENGTITKTAMAGNGESGATIIADLLPTSGPPSVHSGDVSVHFTFKGAAVNNLTSGKAVVTVIPEPGTLGLLGTGLIGLAGLTKRKFKVWS